MYTFLTNVPFCVPTNLGHAVNYSCPIVPGQLPDLTPLTRTKQASINTNYAWRKHYLLSLQNVECACFNALDAQVNNAFKVSNDPTIQGWHAGMSMHEILDQLSANYGQPTPAGMELNDTNFCGQYSTIMPLKLSSSTLINALKVQSWATTHASIVNWLIMWSASFSQQGSTRGHLRNGTTSPMCNRCG